jgi:hypothetical protein
MKSIYSKIIISKLVNQIHKGSAKIDSNEPIKLIPLEQDSIDLDFDSLDFNSMDLSKNIEELFAFIDAKQLAKAVVIVDSQGLVVAENNNQNKLFELLTASFPSYIQMLEFAELSNNNNGFWVKYEEDYLCLLATTVNDQAYGIAMQCTQLLSTENTLKLNKLLKRIIEKGINYE